MTLEQPFPDYELLDRVGAGAMGTVFKARQRSLSRIVAIKVLKPSLARDARYVDRLRREARIVGSLSHPNIVAGYDLGEAGGYHFFVMEFVEGKSLRQLLGEWGMFAEDYICKVGQQVAAALDHAYQRSVIHRDIKPGNILIDELGNVKLTDMGLAKGPADLALTRDGATVGTPQYISPEQARNPQDVDVRSDLYSLGATLYHMATGQPPFVAETMAQLLTKVLNEPPAAPKLRNPALSEGLNLVIRKLLSKDLTVRYQTPRELLDDFARLASQQPVAVDEQALSAQEHRGPSALKRSLLTVLAAVLLGAAVWLGMQMSLREPSGQDAAAWLVELDRELAAQTTPGARLLAVRRAKLAALPGAEVELLARERQAVAELRAAGDALVGECLGERWPSVLAWLADPVTWPDAAQWQSERLAPLLAARCGMSLAQLSSVVIPSLEQLRAAVTEQLLARDARLLGAFSESLTQTIPARAEERVRAGDFAAAERLWREAFVWYFDGVQAPLPERMDAQLAAQARDRFVQAQQRARPSLEAAEASVAAALVAEADELARTLREQLASGADPQRVSEWQQRWHGELLQCWPAAARFRVGKDPWPSVEQQLRASEREIAAAVVEQSKRRLERQLDLVWRTFAFGDAREALRVLELVAAQGVDVTAHRSLLQAANAVAEQTGKALAEHGQAIVVYPRGSHAAATLRAVRQGEAIAFRATLAEAQERAAVLAEFRVGDVLAALRLVGDDPLRALPPQQRQLGELLYSMLGDELQGVAERLQGLDHELLCQGIWPRLVAVRREHGESWLDRDALFNRLRLAYHAVQQQGRVFDLEAALLACERRVTIDELLPAERQALQDAKAWLLLERRRKQVLQDIADAAPRGSEVAVQDERGRLTASVLLPAPSLLAGAADGWRLLEGGVLEFAGASRPWAEIQKQQMACATGLSAAGRSHTAEFELEFPSQRVGRRAYLLLFHGVATVFVLDAKDGAHAAVVVGSHQTSENVQQAFALALHEALQPAKAVVVAGGRHQVRLELKLARSQPYANLVVSLDGVPLTTAVANIEPRAAGQLALLPLQEVRVHHCRALAEDF